MKAKFVEISPLNHADKIEAALLVVHGKNDPRVPFWEPAKWVAKMRTVKTDKNLLAMKINMGAGHFGKSGRYAVLEETSEQYAFLLMTMGITR